MTSLSEPPPSIGLVGGKYQLVKMIGRGGMGSVWEARHASLGTPSAIKFIEAEYANSQEARSRFDKEAKAAATIQSKHAIQIYDHGVTDDGKPYIVMELLTGEPLDKRIERLGSLKLDDTARIIQQVSRGLSRAHERGIVHRDLKPENIFIVRNTDDDEEIAKVLDFGIAKIQNSPHSPGITSSTKTGAVLGTPFYMSPEQARGLRNVDHRTDVWSLGVIAYKCITGRLPFDGESVGDLLVKICTAPIPIPSHTIPGLPQAFDTWFLRALEREPERRFSSVTELAEHLAFAAGLSGSRTPGPMMSGHQPQPMSATIAAASGQPHSALPYSGQGTPPPGMQSVGAGTPHPAGMTAAPFTSSQPVPGVGASRWKWVVGAALIGLTVAAAGTGVAVMVKRQKEAALVTSGGITQAPPAGAAASGVLSASAVDNLGSTTPPAPPPVPAATDDTASNAAAASAAAAAANTPPIQPTPLAAAGKQPFKGTLPAAKNGKAATGPVTAPPPPAGTGAAAALPPPVAAVPPPPPPATAGKKPNKSDPGY